MSDEVPDEDPHGHASGRPPIVGIGASAGGLEALEHFFQNLPDDLGMAYVVIMHLSPDHESQLPAILARCTSMPVIQVADHDEAELRPDTIYVIAPNRKLEIREDSVGASEFKEARGERAAIDLFFRSLAAANGEVFAVLMSGGGTDGAVGAKAVKEVGGLVLVQDPREAAHDSMPKAAIATGIADVVLPASQLAERLAELAGQNRQLRRLVRAGAAGEPAEEAALEGVLTLLLRRTGHDFSKYKRNTVIRRLVRRMQLNHRHSIDEYRKFLQENVEEVQALFNDLLISVTAFFRDPDAWAALRQYAIVPLIERTDPGEPLRCWVPGCATGEEAYSLAILISEEMERRRDLRELIIFASDLDESALTMAREGIYPRSIDTDVSEERLRRWFTLEDEHYRVNSEIRDRVVFAMHSLQRDPPFSRQHLISCRNLLIYLDRDLQEQVMKILHYSCREDGYLFLGISETASTDLFQPLDKPHRIFRPRALPEGRRPALPELPASTSQLIPKPLRGKRQPEGRTALERHVRALESNAPPSVLVDEHWNIVHLSERVGRFLQLRGGVPTQSITETVHTQLRDETAAAVRTALEEREPYLSPFLPVLLGGSERRVAVLVQPAGDADRSQALVMFLEGGAATEEATPSAGRQPMGDRERTLQERLRQAEQYIVHLRNEHHMVEEDLRAANEELQSLNEEYRSTTEELETSKEELQSINEELQTVNNELKTKLEEVSRAHNDLENLMAATDIATLFLDRSLCIKRFTPQLADVFNVKSYDLGRSVGDITHKLEYDNLERDAADLLTSLTPFEREIASRDGRVFLVRMRPYRTAEDRIDGVVITLLDVTKLKRAEDVLRDSEERFRALVDASTQMVWTTDAEGRITEDSPSARAYTGQSSDEWKYSGWLGAVHPEDRPAAQDAWRRSLEDRASLQGEYRVYHAPSDRYRWASVRAVPLEDHDKALRGWVGMNIDITELKEAEAELREQSARKDEFLAMLGHELRNPLAAIRNSIELATSDSNSCTERDEWRRRSLSVVDRQSTHMTRLVNDLLDITRVTRNILQLHRVPTDVVQCVEDVASAVQPQIGAARLKLELSLPEERLHVDADPERLVQVLDNLLQNAINFTPSGGRISVSVRQGTRHAAIRIRDSGIGMKPEELATLFEPYRRSAPGMRGGEGLGLGLALVKRLIDLHGGTISAHSDGPSTGTEFTLTIPLADAHPTSARSWERPPPRRVLVVDDDADVADTFGDLLKSLGQEVRVAHDGDAALQTVKDFEPDVAFLDLSMPGMDGYQLAQRLRETFSSLPLKLVALSGYDRKARAGMAGEQRFDFHLLKPASLDKVVELLNRLGSG